MASPVTPDMLDSKTPKSVVISSEAPRPHDDPTMGVKVAAGPRSLPKNRLVAIGDSLTHGFQSGAIFNTDLSWPAIVAWEMSWDNQFRRPHYGAFGGLPINIEYMIRSLEEKYGDKISWWEFPSALFHIRNVMDQIEDYWERGAGSHVSALSAINHNLSIYGWDLRDCLSRTADICAANIQTPKDDLISQIVENANDRAALRVLDSARNKVKALTVFEAAAELGKEGTVEDPANGNGIETLVVMLGANNALGSVVKLKVIWSKSPDYKDLKLKAPFTVWDPDHFKAELDLVVQEVAKIRASHVVFATVPHVTVAPIARGVGVKVRPGSRYFPYYTRPWITDDMFDPKEHEHITEQEARAVDSAIDQYNSAIADAVKSARAAGKDWYILDLAGMLDRLAQRRYILDPNARPDWWSPYPLPPLLQSMSPVPDSCFFTSGTKGRSKGGLFSLDGVHPTTIAYGLMAQEVINIMQRAGVVFFSGDQKTPRPTPVTVEFGRLLSRDSLNSNPPRSLQNDLRLIAWLDEKLGWIVRLFA